ncbi:MAG: 50S ribosomal protein L25 [Planctomycetota bacterium]|nr:MAG: 50S ribosomal protein L25 [Planctomycetota bacterium]
MKIVADDLRPIIHGRAHVVDLNIDGAVEKALIREVAWDTYGKYVRHVDFLRVSEDERVTASVPLQFVGTPVGLQNGGIMEQPLHAVEVECLAIAIPDVFKVRVNELDVDDSLSVSDIKDIPEGVTILDPPESVIVQVVPAPTEEELEAELEEEGAVPAEPELITRESDEDEEESSSDD